MIALKTLLGVVVIAIVVLVNTIVVMWCERKWLGHMQSRQGPLRTGWHGALQPFADAIKLLGKEDIVPANVDRPLFLIAPIIAFIPSLLTYAAMPWIESFVGASLDVGIFMVFAITAIFPVSMLFAGWSSFNKYSLIGGFRAAAQQVSYEVPMAVAIAGVVMLAESMRISDIVNAQHGLYYIILQPCAAILFFIAMLAEINRTPFDMPESESELVGGINTEYSSMRFALFFVAEYINVFTWSLIFSLLFLGGWNGPLFGGWDGPLGMVWLLLKTYAVIFMVFWVRATLPRVRIDQLTALGWRILLPFALASVFITAIGVFTNNFVLIVLEVIATAALVWLIARIGERAGEARRSEASARRCSDGSAIIPDPGSSPGSASGTSHTEVGA
ncbi:MAG: NADH-quinone oxidoreductase subunit NuoH [Coriobacteriia bacterium]|nr:NADH-quinone oxidoreductase subunit NuoH [Coriobacteriia bacterium]